ncbi:MAG: outer membrane beta-barrel protein [Spirochaetes bacterium]|uniref:Outer membrane beta-barrel protein n=1 Tax=Candidatus Gallitreponema excrementavium TaxID=2840840 RepID=A0A9D9HPP4_9SPIR|nr:outer membrane beta-barrel protein [Candidatus Gallitreponema excrementavium]
MKKIILALVLLCVIFPLAFSSVSLGVRANGGLNLGTKEATDSGDIPDKKVLPGFGAGLYARWDLPIVPFLGIQSGLDFYSGNGIKYAEEDAGESYSLTYSYNTLDIPVLVTFRLPLGLVKTTLFAGPNFSFPVGKVKGSATGAGAKVEGDAFEFDSIMVFGMQAGIDTSLGLGPLDLVLGLRYINDFANTRIKYSDSVSEDFLTRRNLILSLGVEFGF